MKNKIEPEISGGGISEVGKNPHAVALGSLGGKKSASQRTTEQRKEISQKAIKARWDKYRQERENLKK